MPACTRRARDPMLTYFNGDYGLSVRYPASWKTDQAQQEGVWYRYFLGPPVNMDRKPSVSVTLLAGPLGSSIDEYAQTYLAGNQVTATHDEERQGARGKSYEFASSNGATRYALLLLREDHPPAPVLPAAPRPRPSASPGTVLPGGPSVTVSAPIIPPTRVYGLYAQAEAPEFEKHRAILDDMAKSLTLERPAFYAELRNDAFGYTVRLPPSWTSSRSLAGGTTLMTQYTSPALAADKGQTVHASLTLTVEPAPGGLEPFYTGARAKMGDAFSLFSHATWQGGYVDVMGTETPVSESRVKRYYRAAGGRGYSLAFEAREDVFARVSHWCDLIAGTFRVAGEAGP